MKNATTFLILAITLLVVLAATLFYDQEEANESNKGLVVHTYEVTGHIQLFFNRLKDLELGQRGYRITNDEKYLAPYYDALKDSLGNDATSAQLQQHHSVKEELSILRNLTQDNPSQRENLDEMSSDVEELLNYWAAGIKSGQTSDSPTTAASFDFHREDQLMDQVHKLVSIMTAEENRLLGKRTEAAAASRRKINLIISWGILAFYLCIIFSIIFYQKSREKARARLLHYTQQLEVSRHDLHQSNRQKDAILASSDYMIIASSNDGTVHTFNKAAEQSLGYTAEEIIGKLTPAIWHDHEEIRQRATELSNMLKRPIEPGYKVFTTIPDMDGGEEREWTFIHKNGKRFPVRLTVTVLRDENNAIGGYLGIIKDISKEKEDAEQRKITEENLRHSEETFRSAMENASIGMALVDPGGRWLRVNTALCELLGYESEELLKTNFQALTHPDDLNADLDNVRKMLTKQITSYEMEKRYFHKNGRTIWALLNVSLVRRRDGEPGYFISQIQDITERKEMDRMKGEFISIVSHELRTPLTSIRGSLGLIAGAMSKNLPEKVVNLVNIAYKNSERLILLINDILDIDKIAAGQMRFDIKQETLVPLIQQAVDANRSYAEKFGVNIALEAITPSIMLDTDASRLAQVFGNLISNAAKFSPKGSAVRIYAASANGKIRISIEDHGPGIPEEFRSRIFSKFSQADSSATRAKGGTGLGLHITKEIVEHMNGQIGFDTETGKGTTFWIEFRDASIPAVVMPYANKPVSGRDAYRVLICEDDADIITILKMQMEQAGFNADTASSIAEARDKLQNHGYAAMTLDLMFPMGNGLEFIRELRAAPGTSSLPIVVVSARAEEGKRTLNGDAFGIVDWLKKPLDRQQLVNALWRAIAVKDGGISRVLHVEDDEDLSKMLATALSSRAELVNVRSIKEAKELLAKEKFSLVILDVGLPDGNGLALLTDMNDSATPVPVLILSANEIPQDAQQHVAAAMVKARMSETKVVETILSLISHHATEDNR